MTIKSRCGSYDVMNSRAPQTVYTQRQMEAMYPQIYYIIYPEVCRYCDMLDRTYGQSYMMLTRSQLEPMVDEIYQNVDARLSEQSVRESDYEASQYRGRGFLRDIIWIIFLQELFGGRRRRRRYPGYGRPFSPYGPYR